MRVVIINGPNLNLLGKREEGIYGSETFEDYLKKLIKDNPDITIEYFQSNIEGELITLIQNAEGNFNGIILNAAAYTHTSVGISDAVRAVSIPTIEVHISNTFSREDFRHKSFISPYAAGVIIGFGLKGYSLALEYFRN
ncbi:MAG TPA: type II 3-dehydroquinate dehydratase [Flavobacteriaceae bacterium]|nr:type II 3-dehydroquinate dehydratase [Flavobacteriaceae bacterium]